MTGRRSYKKNYLLYLKRKASATNALHMSSRIPHDHEAPLTARLRASPPLAELDVEAEAEATVAFGALNRRMLS